MQFLSLLSGMIQKDPWFITSAISTFMGWIIDFVFNIIYSFMQKNSLGLSIIVLTIMMRFLMLPLGFKSQRSMIEMQKLAPEIEKIKKKYGDTKDPEIAKNMNAEMQALYTKNKISPLSGCLPMLIQMPIFFALNYLMNQSFLFIGKLRDIYEQLAAAIYSVPHWTGMIMNLATAHVPKDLMPYDIMPVTDTATGVLNYHNLEKILNRFTNLDWEKLFHGDPLHIEVSSVVAQATPELFEKINSLYMLKHDIEIFFGLNLLDAAGWAFPGILIPILTAVTTFLTSWLSMKMSAKNSQDPNVAMQQKVMMFAMPLLMGWFTVNYPVGVALYWITSSIFQVVQQIFLNRKYAVSNS